MVVDKVKVLQLRPYYAGRSTVAFSSESMWYSLFSCVKDLYKERERKTEREGGGGGGGGGKYTEDKKERERKTDT